MQKEKAAVLVAFLLLPCELTKDCGMVLAKIKAKYVNLNKKY